MTSPVWESYAQVVLAMRHCAVIATDSGSIQEEANILEVPCVTLRFGSDRGESLLAGGNFLAPPVDSRTVANAVHLVYSHVEELQWERVYPSGASRMLIDAVERRLARRRHPAELRGVALRAQRSDHASAMTPSSAVEVSRSLRGITRTV